MNQLALLEFPPVVRKMPTGTIVRDAFIEDDCRFWLKRAWGPGPCIAWVGLNPSTADATKDDPTMLREIGFSFRWGFGSLIKLNIFPFITADPAEMRKIMSKGRGYRMELPTALLGMQNDEICAELLTKADMRMAAWGNGATAYEVNDWLYVIAMERDQHTIWGDGVTITDWKCLGTNANGSPRHTLSRGKNRVPDDFVPVPWTPRGATDGAPQRNLP